MSGGMMGAVNQSIDGWEIVTPTQSGGQMRLRGSVYGMSDEETMRYVAAITDGLQRAGHEVAVFIERRTSEAWSPPEQQP